MLKTMSVVFFSLLTHISLHFAAHTTTRSAAEHNKIKSEREEIESRSGKNGKQYWNFYISYHGAANYWLSESKNDWKWGVECVAHKAIQSWKICTYNKVSLSKTRSWVRCHFYFFYFFFVVLVSFAQSRENVTNDDVDDDKVMHNFHTLKRHSHIFHFEIATSAAFYHTKWIWLLPEPRCCDHNKRKIELHAHIYAPYNRHFMYDLYFRWVRFSLSHIYFFFGCWAALCLAELMATFEPVSAAESFYWD